MCGATVTEPVTRPRSADLVSLGPLLLALALTALITAVRMTGTVDSDVAWQLWIAQRIHAGADLYRDIIETNPPLWFWMALPVDRVATLLHVRPEPVLVAAMGLLVALSLAATERLIRHIDPKPRTLMLGFGALALAAMPWAHVGQREHIALIGTIPYAALIAARREGRRVPAGLAILIGIGAALGFALKQYFLLVPTALELWLLAGLRGRWRAARPETAAIVGVGLGYAAALVALERDFLTTIVPLIRLANGVFGAPSLSYMFGPFAILGLTILAFALAHAKLLAGRRRARLAEALLVASLAFAAIYFIQFKGWPYHAIPLIGCASLALAALLAEAGAPSIVLRVGTPVLLALPLLLSAQEQRTPSLPSPDLLTALDGLRPGDSVGFLTTETAVPWSVTLQGRYRYASRYNGFWMMRAIIRNEVNGDPDPRLSELGRRIVAETVTDFECTPPARIFVSRPRPGEDGFDILPFFLRDPRFAELLSHYRVRGRTSLETYELISPLSRAAGPCRAGI
jgi:hypothetical protein